MKNKLYILIILCFVFLLNGCSENAESQSANLNNDPIALWIVTEETTADGMNHQAKTLIDQFCDKHENVQINLEILPIEEAERSERLKTIISLINIGQGPDVYLLPTTDILTVEKPHKYTSIRVKPLFPDVNVAMRQGIFVDISEMYISDDTLGKEYLNSTIMDAGIVNNAQYVLPLRFDIPVVYIWENVIQNKEDIKEAINSGIISWMQYVVDQEDPVLACGAEYNSLHIFSNPIDYEQKKVSLSPLVMEVYLKEYQAVQSLIGTEYKHRSAASLDTYVIDMWDRFPVQIGRLARSLVYAAIASAEDETLTMYPLRTVEGDCMATVKYYTAIGADCEYPELAYEFCRLFLLEDSQWEKSRLKPESEQYFSLIEDSWPVRSAGSTAPLWNNLKMQISDSLIRDKGSDERRKKVMNIKLLDSDISILTAKIDLACFPMCLSTRTGSIFTQLNDYEKSNQPSNVVISDLAKEMITIFENSLIEYEKIFQ